MTADTSLFSIFLPLFGGLGLGTLIGWLLAGRNAGRLRTDWELAKAETERRQADFRAAISDLEKALVERDEARIAVSALTAEQKAALLALEEMGVVGTKEVEEVYDTLIEQ